MSPPDRTHEGGSVSSTLASAQGGREGDPTEPTLAQQFHPFFGCLPNKLRSALASLSLPHLFFFKLVFFFYILFITVVCVLGAMPQCAYGTQVVRLAQ